MKVIFQDQIIDLGEINDLSIEHCIQKLESIIEKTNMYFSHFLVNGVPTYMSFQELVQAYSDKECQIELYAITKEQYIEEMRNEGRQYIDRALPILIDLSDKLYQGEDEVSIWSKLGDLAEGLQYLLEIRTQLSELSTYVQTSLSIEQTIEQFIAAMEMQDFTLLADLVQYEIIPVFEIMKEDFAVKEE